MSDVYFDVYKQWMTDEWYGEILVVWQHGNHLAPLLVLHKDDVERLIKVWNAKRVKI